MATGGGDWEGATGRVASRLKGNEKRRGKGRGHFTDGYDEMPWWT